MTTDWRGRETAAWQADDADADGGGGGGARVAAVATAVAAVFSSDQCADKSALGNAMGDNGFVVCFRLL